MCCFVVVVVQYDVVGSNGETSCAGLTNLVVSAECSSVKVVACLLFAQRC